MAITLLDSPLSTSTTTSPSLSYTVSSGDDRLFVMICVWSDDDGDNRAISSISFGGDTPTYAGGVSAAPSANKHVHAAIYYMLDADIPSGSQTATYTLDGSTDRAVLSVISFQDVKQATPDKGGGDNGTDGAASVALAAIKGAVLIGGMSTTDNSTSGLSWGSGQVEISDVGDDNTQGADYELVSSTGTNTQTSTGNGAANFAYYVAGFYPASTATPSIVGTVLGLISTTIGLYDFRFKLVARERDNYLTTSIYETWYSLRAKKRKTEHKARDIS